MKDFFADVRGQVAIVFTLVVPVLLGAVGMAVDYAAWTAQQRKLQGTADAAAVAAARELYLANTTDAQVEAVADLVARAQIEGAAAASIKVLTDIDHDRGAVEVTVMQARDVYFSQIIGASFSALEAHAVARAAGGGRVCVIGLNDYDSGTVMLQQWSQLTAPDCAVYSNSVSSSGIDVSGSSLLDAELVCSAGGVDGSNSNFGSSEPVTDCPQIQDPLADRPEPYVGGCDFTDLKIKENVVSSGFYDTDEIDENGRTLSFSDVQMSAEEVARSLDQIVLRPGTYCGGLLVSDSNIFLRPGVYVMTNGPLEFRAGSVVAGVNVGFYLHGDDAVFSIESNSMLSLTAPLDGEMAGLLLFEDRSADLDREHVIKSNDASVLLGTIYLSRGVFVVDTNAKVADESAYTAIVARRLELRRRPNLFLNADYDDTDVPVPDGVGPVGGNVFLER